MEQKTTSGQRSETRPRDEMGYLFRLRQPPPAIEVLDMAWNEQWRLLVSCIRERGKEHGLGHIHYLELHLHLH